MGSKPNDSLTRPDADRFALQGGVAVRKGSRSGLNSTISVVHPAELSSNTQQTSGSLRMSAIAAMHGIVSSLWAGIFVVEPSGKTGIHHRGEQDTVVRFAYKSGDMKAARAPETIVPDLPGYAQLRGGGHWKRDVVFSAPGVPTSVPAKGERAEY